MHQESLVTFRFERDGFKNRDAKKVSVPEIFHRAAESDANVAVSCVAFNENCVVTRISPNETASTVRTTDTT